jgi:glycosyltransferase involved in cell wall biosynthesis
MTELKVAHLTTVDSSLRYLLLPQLEAIVRRGGTAVGISAPGPDVEFLVDSGIQHVPLSASTRGRSLISDIKAAFQLWRVLSRAGVDVLHTHNPKPGIYGRIVGRLAGVPVVVNTVHGLYVSDSDPLRRRLAVYLVEGIAALFSDAELVQSHEDVDVMSRFRIGRPSRIVHLGNGIDLQRFGRDRSGVTRHRARAELGLAPEAVVVGCVSRLVAEKGIPELIEAWNLRETGYELMVVGPPDPTKADAIGPEVIEAAEQRGVRFLGHRQDVEDLYLAWDIFVLPSHREGFPRAAMEAAASGLAIVASDIRGCREVVEHDKTGVLVPRQDAEALSTAIDALVRDPARRDSLGRAGREKARAEFDERWVVEKVIDTYRHVALRKGRMDIYDSLRDPRTQASANDEEVDGG